MLLSDYYFLLEESLHGITLFNPEGSPYQALGTEILEMVISYLQDSEFFQKNNDIVNQYASLGYAHGWLNAGSYLGLYEKSVPTIEFSDVLFPDQYKKDHLHEKTGRYHMMLKDAIRSVSPFPGTGSPLALAAEISLNEVNDSFLRAEEFMKDNQYISALGYLCYGYGWLDTAVRAGLFQVYANFNLFTTEF